MNFLCNFLTGCAVVFCATQNNAQISFAARVDFTGTGNNPFHIAVDDLDGDGKPDLVMANYNSPGATVFRNISTTGIINTGSMGVQQDYYLYGGTFQPAIADMDGDGKKDVLVSANGSMYSTNVVNILLNSSSVGTITLASVPFAVNMGTQCYGMTTADFDGDGKTDIAVANNSNSTAYVRRNNSTIANLAFDSALVLTAGTNPRGAAAADLDGDGKPELIIANNLSNSLSVFRNTSVSGTISFAPKVDFTTATQPYDVIAVDMDGDGKKDLVTPNYFTSNSISVLRNISTTGVITFSPKVDFTAGTQPAGIAAADFDNDGKPDLVASNYGSNTISVWRNLSTTGSFTAGSLAPKTDFTAVGGPQGIIATDMDNDGKADVITGNYTNGDFAIFKNNTISTGIAGTDATAGIAFFPNPSDGLYNVQLPLHNGNGVCTIISTDGRLCRTVTFDDAATSIEIDLADEAPGIYFIQLTTGANRINGKLIRK